MIDWLIDYVHMASRSIDRHTVVRFVVRRVFVNVSETAVLPFTGQSCTRVEQSSSRSPSAEHFTAGVQETTENVPILG